jgi:hypothetical protein
MATKININDAAEVVRTGFYDALVEVRDLTDAYVTSMEAVKAKLPVALPMEAARIIEEILGGLSYKRSAEIPGLVARYEAVPTPTA